MNTPSVAAMFGLQPPADPPSRPLVEAQHHDLQVRLRALKNRHRFKPMQPVQLCAGLSYLSAAATKGVGFVFVRYLRWWSASDRARKKAAGATALFRADAVVAMLASDGSTVVALEIDSAIIEPHRPAKPVQAMG